MAVILRRRTEKRIVESGVFWYFSGMTSRQAALRMQRDFFKKMGGEPQLAEALAALPMVAFFIKDDRSRFMRGNAQLLRILNRQHEWEVLGRCDADFLPAEIASAYVEEDRLVMRTGKALTRYTQMVPHLDGPLCWYLVSKTPLHDRRGRICGVAVTMYELNEVVGVAQPFGRIEAALQHLHTHYSECITTSQLARMVHLSESQFVRLFRALIGEPPMRYLVRQRIHAACRELIATGKTSGTIALDCGFYDQSAFTRAFRAQTGTTPANYRRRHLSSVSLREMR